MMKQLTTKTNSALRVDSARTERSGTPYVIGIDLGTTNSLLAIAGLQDDTSHLPAPALTQDGQSSLGSYVPVRLLKLPQRNLDGTMAEHVLFPSVVFQAAADTSRYIGMGAREAKFHYTHGRSVFYSVKRDLGTDRDPYYPRAITPDLNTPVKVTAAILRAMKEAAEDKLGRSLSDIPTVVTIPASFQSAQRRDTLTAARMAGLWVDDHSLFDEPNAALLAHMNRQRVQLRWHHEETVMVFDFGGGTCDVSVIDVSFVPSSLRVNLRSLAISRYEQLGGDDIDRHIVHTHLAERFYTISGRGHREWSLAERRHGIWSQLARSAELLKVRFCEELEKVTQMRGWDESTLKSVQVALPPQTIHTSQGDVVLQDLSMDWPTFEQIMSPFVKVDCTENSGREYYRITSIFSPVLDTLDKANLQPRDITRILLVGGSSFNPLIERALHEFFSETTIDRPMDMDFLVGEGAAVQAYCRFIIGHDILAPIVGDTIGLLTEGEQFIPLVRAGSPIPFPDDSQWMTYRQFRVPRDLMSHVDLVVCAGSAERPVHVVKLTFDRIVPRNAAVHLKIRFDGNKIFHLEAFLPEYPEVRVAESVENPLAQTPLTPLARERIELEKRLAAAQEDGALDQHVDDMVRMAEILDEMDRDESALEWVDIAIRRRGQATPEMKAIQASCHYQLGEMDSAHRIWSELADQDRSSAVMALNAAFSAPDLATREKYTRQAVTANPGDGMARFALASLLRMKGNLVSARENLDQARQLLEQQLRYWPDSPILLLYLAEVHQATGNYAQAAEFRERYQRTSKRASTVDTRNLVALTSAIARS